MAKLYNKICSCVKKMLTMKNVALVLAIVIVCFVIMRIMKQRKIEAFGTPSKMIYFYMNNCGHCVKFTPTWEKFVNEYQGDLKLEKIERADAGDQLSLYGVSGFPTVVLVDENGEYKDFDGDRTVAGLTNFADEQ